MGRLSSCSYCGRIHDNEYVCDKKQLAIKNRQRKSKDRRENQFHWSNEWKKKSLEIRNRDKYLCQLCLSEGHIVYNNLSVHHIESLVDAWDLRLDNDNLITLCNECHEKAEGGEISKERLKDIVRN